MGRVLIATTSAPSRVELHVLVGQGHELGSVGDHDDGAPLGEAGEQLVHQVGRVGVEVRGGLVEEQHRRGGEHGPGQGEARPLPGRQAEPVVAERGGEAPGQARDEAFEADQAQRLPDGLVPGAGAEHEGVAQGARGEERALGDEVGAAGAPVPAVGGAVRPRARGGSTCRRRTVR